MLRSHAGIHGHFSSGLVEHGFVGQLIKLVTGQGLAVLGDDAKVGGDAGSSQRVVAGDHHGADAGTVRLGHGIADLSARRVDDADHAVPDKVGFDGLGLFGDVGHLARGIYADTRHIGQRAGFQRSTGLTKRAVCLGREAFDGGQNRLTITFGELADLAAHANARAVAQQHVRRTLGEHGQFAGIGVVFSDDGHALAFGGERNLAHASVTADLVISLDLASGNDQ